jgi:hypothetical protein
MAHLLMTLEAINVNGLPANGIAQRLRNNPAEVQKLTRFRVEAEVGWRFEPRR